MFSKLTALTWLQRCCDGRESSGQARAFISLSLLRKEHAPQWVLTLLSITARWPRLLSGNSDDPTKVGYMETSVSQDPVSSTGAEWGLQNAISSSLIRNSNGTLTRGEKGIDIYLCQFHWNPYRREGTKKQTTSNTVGGINTYMLPLATPDTENKARISE